MIDNNCETCNHKNYPDGGWCYMFREEPITKCMQHTALKRENSSESIVPLILTDIAINTVGVAIDVAILDSLSSAPAAVFKSGDGGDFGGAGASASWDIGSTISDAAGTVSDAADVVLSGIGDAFSGLGDVAGDLLD